MSCDSIRGRRRARGPGRSAAVALAAVLAAASTASAADSYPVKLDRPVKVGQQFKVTAKADVNRTVKVDVNGDAQPDRVEKFTAELAGTARVEAVNDKTGAATKVRLTIDKLTRDGDEVFPAGTVVSAERAEADPTFTLAGGEAVDAEQTAVLAAVVEVGRADVAVGADAMFGTAEPRRVGDTWTGDAGKVARSLTAGVPVTADHLKATAKLLAVKPVDGVPAEVIELTTTADALEAGKAVRQMTVTSGTFTSTLTRTVPVDPSRPPLSSDEHVSVKMDGTAGGGAATVNVSVERTVHRTMVEVK